MPDLLKFPTKKARNAWYREYFAKNRKKRRKYNREWMRAYRAKIKRTRASKRRTRVKRGSK